MCFQEVGTGSNALAGDIAPWTALAVARNTIFVVCHGNNRFRSMTLCRGMFEGHSKGDFQGFQHKSIQFHDADNST
jgi:hypothetical protein